jgi:multidrug efflux pump subunit AcrA (membrane-fusion protein)
MTASSEFTSSVAGDQSFRDATYEELIYRLAQMMREAVEPDEFEDVLLQYAVRGLHAPGGILWKQNDTGESNGLIEQANQGQPFSTQLTEDWQTIRREVVESRQPRVVRLQEEPLENGSPEPISELERLVMLQPLAAESQSAVLLEVHQLRSDLAEEVLNEYQTFLAMLSELHSEYLKNQKLKRFEEQSHLWKSFESFSRKLQGLWNPPDLYAHIVDGGRELCGFDRLTLLTGSGSRCRVQTVSCTDHPSRHSESVQKLQRLCGLLTTANQELRYDGASEPVLAPEIQSKLNDVLHASSARLLHAVPLKVPDPDANDEQTCVTGVLVGEHFRAGLDSTAFSRLQQLAAQAAPAVARAAYWESLPAKWLLRGWIALQGSPFQHTRSARAWVLLTALLLVSLLVFVPADFEVKSTGQLQPVDQQHVFAPMDAIVGEIHFREDRPIRADQPLLSLRDPDLELKLEEVRGERARVETRLRTIQTLRSNLIRSSSKSSEDDELAAEANELRQQRDSLEAQWEILTQKQKKLNVRSPTSGVVLTWNSQELLTARPVTAGQLLLTIADVNGAWRIDVKIPENEIGHVREALRENSGELPLEFSLDAQVGESYAATLREDRIARRAEIDPELQHFFRAAVSISSQQEFEPLSGAEVSVRIHCGSRALGYVLFHDLYEWLQRNIFF